MMIEGSVTVLLLWGCPASPPVNSGSGAMASGSSALRASVTPVVISLIRSTRRPGARSPSAPPARPAAGAASLSPLLMASIALSASLVGVFAVALSGLAATVPPSSPLICTIASCAVSSNWPLCSVSPSLSTRNKPSAPRTQACPQIAITIPLSVLLSIGMRVPCARAQHGTEDSRGYRRLRQSPAAVP